MRKIFLIFFVIFLLIGCTNNDKQLDDSLSQLPESTPESAIGTETIHHIDIKTADINDLMFFSKHSKTSVLNEMIIEKFKFDLTTLVITKDLSSVAWMFEGSLTNLSSEDIETLTNSSLGKNDYGKYIYVGNLVQLSDNVFSSKGNFLPSAELVKKTVSQDIDFYLIFSDDKVYMCTDNVTLDELKGYQSESYFKQ